MAAARLALAIASSGCQRFARLDLGLKELLQWGIPLTSMKTHRNILVTEAIHASGEEKGVPESRDEVLPGRFPTGSLLAAGCSPALCHGAAEVHALLFVHSGTNNHV